MDRPARQVNFLCSQAFVSRPASLIRQRCLTARRPRVARRRLVCAAGPADGDAGPANPVDADADLAAPPDPDALLGAFDAMLDGVVLDGLEEEEEERKMSAKERRKLAREREVEAARLAHIQRLEILTALPAELVVEAEKDRCTGCGCAVQSHDPLVPGFLPEHVISPPTVDVAEADGLDFSDFVELDGGPVDGVAEVTSEEGVEVGGAVVGGVTESSAEGSSEGPAVAAVATEAERPRVLICQRCYRLNHYGSIDPMLRVASPRRDRIMPLSPSSGKSSKPALAKPGKARKSLLTPSIFRENLERLRNTNAVLIYLVDVFDFHGTFLTSLRDMIGTKNPILLAVNKVDLLPVDYKPERVQSWVQHECSALGLEGIVGVHLISSTKGTGVKTLLADTLNLARRRRADIYVVGAANVGKSSFINHIMDVKQRERRRGSRDHGQRPKNKPRAGSRPQSTGALTTSVIPGTTLDVIRIPLGGNVSLYDTPGIIMPHQLTNMLDAKELRAVLPSKHVERVTFRLGEGKALFLGGLARIEVVSGKPFFFTAFVSSGVKVHPGRADDAESFMARHSGEMLTPPFSPEGFGSLGEWTSKSFTAEGDSWKRACVDIVFSGLGWVAVTGPGSVRIKVCVPKGVGVFTREALMPFEAKAGVSKYTGTTSVNRKQINKAARVRKQSVKDSGERDLW